MAVRSIEEAKVEAVKRLEVLKAHENVLREFKAMPDCSEFGSIGVEPRNGGIVRTW